jgi:hypothetical protein
MLFPMLGLPLQQVEEDPLPAVQALSSAVHGVGCGMGVVRGVSYIYRVMDDHSKLLSISTYTRLLSDLPNRQTKPPDRLQHSIKLLWLTSAFVE